MWLGTKSDSCSSSRDQLFNDLFHEVKGAAPSAQLSYTLRCRLERCDRETRSLICSKTREGCSPLFVACKRGNVEIVEYLLGVCGAPVEQRGLYEVPDDHSVHNVTPLWCAAVAGKTKVVEVLIKYGADVNSISDTGSTPVRSACFMTHLDIVKLLVKNNADIQRPNYNGGTCLINSVQSVELCEFLLQNNANVNAQDIQNKTALHYAIQEHRFETTKLLLKYGANPFLESRYRDDALQTACLKGAAEIFTYLIDHVEYSPERVASAFELLGSTFLDEHHDSTKAIQYWRAACDIREKFKLTTKARIVLDDRNNNSNLLDKDYADKAKQYGSKKEFANRADLDAIALDLDEMRAQSLMICERILGPCHKDMIYRLMYRGAAYADSLQYQRCIDLWRHALLLRLHKDSLLFCDTCFTAQALAKLFIDLHEKSRTGAISASVKIEDILDTIDMLVKDLPQCAELLKLAPQFKRQQESYDKILRIVTHLLYLVTQLIQEKTKDDQLSIRRHVHNILTQIDPRTTQGDSLLHLSVMRNNTLKSQNLFEDGHYSFFPSFAVAKLLVECGSKLNAINHCGNTPLHAASTPINYNLQIVELLLDNGSHIDIKNNLAQKPSQMLADIPGCKINRLKYQTLRCLAAAAVNKYDILYHSEVPDVLEDFIEAH